MKFFNWGNGSQKKIPARKTSEKSAKSEGRKRRLVRKSHRTVSENRYIVQDGPFAIQEHYYQPIGPFRETENKFPPIRGGFEINQQDFAGQILPGRQQQQHFYYNPDLREIFGRFTQDSLTGFTRDPRKVVKKVSRRIRRKV